MMTTDERIERVEDGIVKLIAALRLVMQCDGAEILNAEDRAQIATAPRATRGRIAQSLRARRMAERMDATAAELRDLARAFTE